MLFGNLSCATVFGIRLSRAQPIPKGHRELGLQCAYVGPGTHSAEWIKPVGVGMMQDGVWSVNIGLTLQRHPEIGRNVRHSVPEKAGRGDADNHEWLSLDGDRRSHERGIGANLRLPCSVADHRRGRGRRSVV